MRLFCVLIFLVFSFNIYAQEKITPVIVDGDEVSYLKEEGKVIAKGNVVMRYEGITLKCDEAIYEVNYNRAEVKGNVYIESEKGIIKAKGGKYDFNNHRAELDNINLEAIPFYGEAEVGERISQDEYRLNKGYLTTCDLKQPHYRLTAKRIFVYPNKKVVAKNMFIKIGNVPIFYIPYFSQSLKDRSFPLELSPGKSKEWGKYTLSRWRYYFNDDNRGKIHLDWYEKRGLGEGLTYKLEDKSLGEALLGYYRLEDKLYDLDKRNSLFEMYPERVFLSSKYLEDDRYKGQVSYHWANHPKLSVVGEFNKFSDEYFMKDFFYREYEVEPHPYSYLLMSYAFNHSSLSLLTRKRMNRFYTEAEYLPQLEYNFYRQSIGNSNFYLFSKSTLGNLNYKFSRSTTDYDAVRMHSENTLSYTKNIKWLYINPYVGSYTTFYSKNVFGEDNLWLIAPLTGIDLGTKLHRIFDTNFNILGVTIERMRHLITPRLSYSYIHPPSTQNNFHFDDIDDIGRREILTFILDNKLQVKSSTKTWDFIYFAPSWDYIVNNEGKGSYFDNIKCKLEIYPYQGLSLVGDSFYSIPLRRYKTFNADIRLKDNSSEDKYYFALGHRYVRQESSQGTLSFDYQLTKRLRLHAYLRNEYNTGDFKEQQYLLRTDLHCWWLDTGINIDSERNYTFWVIFTLKAFPEKIHFGFDHTYKGARKSY
ncbi:MAG: hypothetical protein NC822_03190 [Candidatus Omnitrophica bacterium]|nr:hypothetical protein [Candidatus Omnitrophota bacterium]MCM8826345.1 hypothetical protein [Candidatus Omnitrophota bacterium]